MNNALLGFILALTEAKKGNIPEDKAQDIAMTSSIGSFIPNNLIAPLLVVKKMTPVVQENGTLHAEVNNRISPKHIATRTNKILDSYLALATEPQQQDEIKFFAAVILRVVFSDSHLKLLRKQSPEAIQKIIDVSLTIPDTVPYPQRVPRPDSPVPLSPLAEAGTSNPKPKKG